MKNESNSKANKKPKSGEDRSSRPRFQVEGSIPRKRVSFDLKVTSAQLIWEYAKYLSNQGGYTVTPEAIVERLAEELTRDKHFNAYLQLQLGTEASQHLPAPTRNAEAQV